MTKDEIKKKLELLIKQFESQEENITKSSSSYNETETRSDFINKFFELLGWDVTNERGLPRPLREVILEANVGVDEKTKKPDYEFRFNGIRKFFVEAKKPSLNILASNKASFQIRRYGWSAKLPVSVLTNFRNLVIYDCKPVPNEKDNPRVATMKSFHYKDYLDKYEELQSLLSREMVLKGEFDKNFSITPDQRRGEKLFDDFFLEQVEKWRMLLAKNILDNNPKLELDELNYLIQVFINRIVFLRICEDRNLEPYGSLKTLQPKHAMKQLMRLFLAADNKYDSGLFDFIKDKLSATVNISNDVLLEVVNDLYYPNSSYTFSVIDPKILGDIYEQFISKVIKIGKDGSLLIEEKAEVKAANGIYITPNFIVKNITRESLRGSIENDERLNKLRLADISCGSGVFLLEAYQYLLDFYLDKYINENREDLLREDDNGDYHLSLKERKNILLSHIYGLDIDEQAVEVTKFSLLLKILENVPGGEVEDLLAHGKSKALPNLENNIKCGNSLVDDNYLKFQEAKRIKDDETEQVKPFNWQSSFEPIFKNDNAGFSHIVGNPPYTRIQNLVKYSPLEVAYYQSSQSPYKSSKSNNFDKYQLFIERSISLLKRGGILGYIVPHKFMTIKAGKPLREFIASCNYLEKILHFGTNQIFEGQSTTYTCILILQKSENEEFSFVKVNNLQEWKSQQTGEVITYPVSMLGEKPWVFPTEQERQLFQKLEKASQTTLGGRGGIADIFVGLQTSADDIYIVKPEGEDGKTIHFVDYKGVDRVIEKGILKNAILDVPIDYYNKVTPNKYIIFPYEKLEGRLKLMSEDKIRNRFPKTYKYLLDYKKVLKSRNIGNNGVWYQYGRTQSLNKFDTSKLIIKNPALSACFVFDNKHVLFTGGGNGPYYGIRPNDKSCSLFFLLGLLNHPVFDKWVKVRSSVFRGEYYSYGKQFISEFPVFNPKKANKTKVAAVENLWKQIVNLNNRHPKIPAKKTELLRLKKSLKRKSDNLIYELYGIEQTEK